MHQTFATVAFCVSLMVLPSHAQHLAPGPLLALPDAKAHHITLLDPQTRASVAVIPVSGWPHELAFSADGRLMYAPSYSDHVVNEPGSDGQTIEVIDLTTRAVLKTWDLGRPTRPHRILLSPDGTTLFVTSELTSSIAMIDVATGKLTAEIPTGARPSHMFVLTPDGKKIFTSNLTAGSVSVLDVSSRKLLKIIPVSAEVQRLALSADGRRLFIADRAANNIAVIDTSTDTITQRAALTGSPFSVCLSPDGRWLLVGEDNGSAGQFEALDTQDLKVKHSGPLDAKPYGIRILGDRAFITCITGGNLDILNLSSWALELPIPNLSHGDGIAIWPGMR